MVPWPVMRVGERIGDRYVVIGDLGAGGMGVVVRARDERLGRTVAVKVLTPSALGDAAARARLVREARAVAALDHPGIVHMYDVGATDEGGAYLVMELVGGKTLGDHLREGTLTRAQRIAASVEVGRALAYAHEKGFVHRDIKPDNVMIRDDGRAVVLDFGLAKTVVSGLAATVDAVSVTAKGGFVGTPAYVSPEQARGEEAGPATDQFALAVTVFEAMTGKLPWRGSTALEVISEVLKGEPASMREHDDTIPEALDVAVSRALAKRPRDRFPDVEAFVSALAATAIEVGESATSVRSIRTTATADTAAASTLVDAPPSPRSTLARFAPAVVFVSILLAGGYLYSRGHGATTPNAPAPPPPLAGEGSIVACPLLAASDKEGGTNTGWLGAAAAALVCERAQIMLGGDPARTLVAAELLDLPREPGEDFPMLPFDDAAARDKTVAHARERAAAYIDGSVDFDVDFHVSLVLRRKDGAEVTKGDARGPSLLAAVRDAMTVLRPSLPTPQATPFLATWWLGASVDAALDLHDLHVFDVNEDETSRRDQCKRVRARTDLGGMASFANALCANILFEPPPPMPTLDSTSPATLLTTAATLRFAPTTDESARAAQRDRIKALSDASMKESSPLGRALLLGVAAEISYYALSDIQKSADGARGSIQASAKLVDVRANAWHRQAVATGGGSNYYVLNAHGAWLPWESFAHSNLSRMKNNEMGQATPEGMRRAALLGHSGFWPRNYAEYLVGHGKVQAATSYAVQLDSDYLRALILHAQGKPKAALDLATSALAALPARAENGGIAARLASVSIDIAQFLEVKTSAPADYYTRFMQPDPPALTHGIVTFFSSIGVCHAFDKPMGLACFGRLQTLFDAGWFGAALDGAKESLEAGRRAMLGDYVGAAAAWRPIAHLGFAGEIVLAPMGRVFVLGGSDDVIAKLDAAVVAQGSTLPNADAAYVRAVSRAVRRGDMVTAKKLASEFVARWETADVVPPALVEMRKLAGEK